MPMETKMTRNNVLLNVADDNLIVDKVYYDSFVYGITFGEGIKLGFTLDELKLLHEHTGAAYKHIKEILDKEEERLKDEIKDKVRLTITDAFDNGIEYDEVIEILKNI